MAQVQRIPRLKRLYVVLGGVIAAAFSTLTVVQGAPGSNAAQIHLNRALAYYERGDLPEAIAELQEVLHLRPHDPDIHFMLGNALYRHGDLRTAAGAYRITLEHGPNLFEFEAHMSRGFALYELGEVKDAAAEWLAAVRLNPQEPFARAGLAVGLYRLGRVEEAKEQYTEAVELDKRYADIVSLSIDIRWKPNALTVLERLKEINADGIAEISR